MVEHSAPENSGQAVNVCPRRAEFGEPLWSLGMATYGFLAADRAVCSYYEDGFGKLAYLDLGTGQLTPLDLPFTEFSDVRVGGGKVVFRAGAAEHPGLRCCARSWHGSHKDAAQGDHDC